LEQGPRVAHVAWGVDGIDQAFEGLKSKGNKLRGRAQVTAPSDTRPST